MYQWKKSRQNALASWIEPKRSGKSGRYLSVLNCASENGPYRLYMQAGPENKLPYGNLPRLLMAWVSTEAVQTQSRELVLAACRTSTQLKI